MDNRASPSAFLVIPAIDLLEGRCVRLRQGDYSARTVYNDDPVAVARRWVDAGARRLHLVDLDGARDGVPRNLDVIRAIVSACPVPCQVGGGIRDEATAGRLLEAGAAYVVVGSRAVREPRWMRALAALYPERVLLGLDVRAGRIAVAGWTQTVATELHALLGTVEPLPLGGIVLTAIERDGMLSGPDYGLLNEAAARTRHRVFASGGIACADDIRRLAAMPLAGCIVGKALYEGTVTLGDALRAAAHTKPTAFDEPRDRAHDERRNRHG